MNIDSIITREEFNSMKNPNYDKLCSLLMKTIKLSVEESLKALPHVMMHLSAQAIYLKELSSKFYIDNKDLASNKTLVAKFIEQAEAENPGKSYEDILKIVAVKTREVLSKLNTETKPFNSKLKGI